MGYAATRTMERVAASMGGLLAAAPIEFAAAQDVTGGGVLLALPSLLATGLLTHQAELYTLPKGYYGLPSIFLLLALMALARISSGTTALQGTRRVGRIAGAGPHSGSADATREVETVVSTSRPGGTVECSAG